MRFLRPISLLLVGLALSGCSGDSSSGVGNRRLDDALAGSAPACSVTWVEGKRLPLDYRGCEENGALQGAASLYECLDGSTIALFNERFYGQLGSRVKAVVGRIADDPAYDEFWHDCRG